MTDNGIALDDKQRLAVRDAQYAVQRAKEMVAMTHQNFLNAVAAIAKELGLDPAKVSFNPDTLTFKPEGEAKL